MRTQLRNGDTLGPDEIPYEGEPFWDDRTRSIGVYNHSTGNIDWLHIPVPGETPTIPGVPRGMIVMWYSLIEPIPEGWQRCDGTNGTPNLIARPDIYMMKV